VIAVRACSALPFGQQCLVLGQKGASPVVGAEVACVVQINLETAVERPQAGCDAPRWQDANHSDAVWHCEDLQRRQRGAAWLDRVCSALTKQARLFVSINVSVHAVSASGRKRSTAVSRFNLETAVERARAGCDAPRWQDANHSDAVWHREDLQRRQRGAAWLDRVCSALTKQARLFVSINVSVHAVSASGRKRSTAVSRFNALQGLDLSRLG
jgi:hypothetical protein